MPVSTINGWTSAGLSPSYSILASILGAAGGTPAQAATPVQVGTNTAPTGGPANPFGGTPQPKPGGNGGYGYGGGGGGGGFGYGYMGTPNPRSGVNPALNPQEAYAAYLQNRSNAEMSTPQQSAMNIAYYQHSLLNDADPTGLWQNPSAGAIGRPTDAYLQQAKFQSDLANQLFRNASPYSYAQGVAPAYAPPVPQNGGYSSGWTNNAGGGFGFGY
jgi:hypothetical protein